MDPKLANELLFIHPNIQKAKDLLLSALLEAQEKIQEVQGPDPLKQEAYQLALRAFKEARGASLFYDYIGSGLGNGPLVELLDGSVKYDFIGGIGPHFYGHNHPGLMNALIDSALTNTVMQGHLQQNLDPLHLMQKLNECSGMDHCFLSSSGAMATENGLKIAFQAKKGSERVLAFENCFMGRTLALSHVTDKPQFRQGLPLTLQVDYVPFYDGTEESIERADHILRRNLSRYPGKHAVMCMELIQGEGGFNVGSRRFFAKIMNTLKEHDVAILVDEVQTFGRTEALFAFQHFGLEPFVDIVCIGKLSQVCATLFKDQFTPKPGLLSQTFTASTSAIKAAMYILEDLLKSNMFGKDGKNATTFQACSELLATIQKKHPIKGPYGIGSMFAFSPFEGELLQTNEVAKQLFKKGLITFVAGKEPSKVRMLIPVPALREGDLKKVFQIIDETLDLTKKNLW